MSLIDDAKPSFDKFIEHFQGEIKNLRTGRATSAMIEHVSVLAYGTATPLQQLGSVQVPDPRTLVVSPWDKSILKDIEKALIAADLGFGVVNKGDAIYLTVPSMTEEKRLELVKKVRERSEAVRIQIRGHRDVVKEDIARKEKAKELTEDDRYRLQEDLDKLTGGYNDQIKKLVEDKEADIMKI